ncbi:hypothetical protein D3C80_1841190 [compost metagenome]
MEQRLEEGVVGAAQNERVATSAQQGLDIAGQQPAQIRVAHFTLLDQFHQPRAGLSDHPHVAGETVQQGGELCALQSPGRGQYANHAGTSSGSGRLYRRLHAHDGPIGVAFTQVGHGGHGRGVTG